MGGHEADFNPPLEEKYKCPVCLAALRDPVQTKCGHRMCGSCFKTVRGGNWYFRCPVDNTWSNHVFEDNAVKREILSLKVNCDNSACDWVGELRELQTHLENCPKEKIDCPNNCNTDVMRIDLDKHLLECPLRLTKCEHCQVEVVVQQLARHHVLMCPKFPVNCPICGEAEIMREQVNAHINPVTGDCPMVKVPCSFRHIGCMHEAERCKMPKHYAEQNTQHIMMLSERLVALETNHKIDLEVCTKKFETVMDDLQAKLSASEQRNEKIETQLRELLLMQEDNNSKSSKLNVSAPTITP